MNDRLDCEIVRDLLPSYVDGLTSDVTNKAVEEHVKDCTGCAEALSGMRAPEPPAPVKEAEVDYLKKVRVRTARVGMICGIVMMIIGMLTIFSKVYLIGSRANPEEVRLNISVSGGKVYVSGNMIDLANGVSRVEFSESAGMVCVDVYRVPHSIFTRNSFSKEYVALSHVNAVRCGDLILWENGVEIGSMAARLYAAQNPFLGDMPSNSRVAKILDIGGQFGAYTNELETSKEPYIWRIELADAIAPDEEKAALDIMTADSYVMLAVIGNLGSVEWNYETDAGKRTHTVTEADATAFAGRNIKECTSSPSELQELIARLSIKWAGVRETLQEKGTFRIRVQNNTDSRIRGYEMEYYLDDKQVGECGTVHANGSLFAKGEDNIFEFTPQNFPDDTTAIGLQKFNFTLYVVGEDGKKVMVGEKMPVPARYAWIYFYSLSGSFESGFTFNAG